LTRSIFWKQRSNGAFYALGSTVAACLGSGFTSQGRVARDAAKFLADVRLSAFRRRDPVVCGPRRIVPDVLPMSTFKLSNPIQLLILMKANDLSRLTFELALRLHASFSPERPIMRLPRKRLK